MPRQIRIKRVYDPPARADGRLVLVDRLWPRGLKKAEAAIDLWLKEVAPSTALRRWFDHDPARWDEFRRRYAKELDDNRGALAPLLAADGTITLLYSAHDPAHNNAVALAAWLGDQK